MFESVVQPLVTGAFGVVVALTTWLLGRRTPPADTARAELRADVELLREGRAVVAPTDVFAPLTADVGRRFQALPRLVRPSREVQAYYKSAGYAAAGGVMVAVLGFAGVGEEQEVAWPVGRVVFSVLFMIASATTLMMATRRMVRARVEIAEAYWGSDHPIVTRLGDSFGYAAIGVVNLAPAGVVVATSADSWLAGLSVMAVGGSALLGVHYVVSEAVASGRWAPKT